MGTVYRFCGFLHYPRNPSPWLLIPRCPPRDSPGRGDSLSGRERGGGACSSSFSGLLQPDVRRLEDLGSWRPVIDLSLLNRFIVKTPFTMETIQSVLPSVRQGDWMVSIDLKGVYLQVPIHPDSRKYLKFVAFSEPYQFRALCFGLSTAPQVFTRVMAPISSILHSLGIRIRRYLNVGGKGHGRLVYVKVYLVYRELCHLVQYTCPIVLPIISGL